MDSRLVPLLEEPHPYDEQVYLQSLQKRNSPLNGMLAPGAGLGWKDVAGFQKPSENPS